MSSKTDEDHSGIGFQKATQMLEVHSAAGDGLGSGTPESETDSQDGADDLEQDVDDDPGSDPGSEQGSQDIRDQNDPGSENPTMGRGPPEAETCPDCGSEDYYDATEVLRAGEHGPEATRALTEHDRVCADCQEVYSPDG
ncbi:hypothetical protein DV707_07045 [Halobellus limi]|uniref:Small CPxCG-related zinc finger protein n=2 Tax=Halobellus limi TaxID=699433 RepID=A0A1H5T0X9_9EURY|nr:hypothetical protein DV707_07045 [Halobellus limi]SEF56483.1 hypothetical protein SAMN04488133_0139 [Halobellus limi]